MNLYCIPGYGTDSRLFKNLILKNYTVKFINWAEPDINDTLSDYAEKLIPQIDTTKPFSLLGMSLGGFLSVELSHKINPEHIFIVSSVKSSSEIPSYLQFIRQLGLRQLINAQLVKKSKRLLQPIFGKVNHADKDLLYRMIDESDNQFTTWAGRQITVWKSDDSQTPFKKITHIIGDKDLLYSSKIKNAQIIKGGTHLMMLDRAAEINAIVDGKTNKPLS